jgi:glycolate oxidase FAD binding subunit
MPAAELNVVEQLVAIAGNEYVRSNEDTIFVSPADTQQVSEVLRFANKNRLTVTPIGGGTKQSWGNPIQTNIRLDLTRLNRVIEHPWQDLTCTVQAGCTWQELQQTLAKHGQFVALDPLWPERATVGGILASNDSGALRHRYGSLRDLVIGMTLVLADGTIARSGGKVVKNVAGYDLCKLVTGSLGTLAVITEATFRLHPLPQHCQNFSVAAPQAAQLAPLMAIIRGSHLLTQALQLRGDNNGFHLDIQLNAHPEAHQDDILTEMTASQGLVANKASEEVWQAREQLFETNEKNLLLKITVPPIGVAEIAHDFTELHGNTVIQSLGISYASVPLVSGDIDAVFAQIEVLSVSADCNSGNLLLLRAPDGHTRELLHRLEKHIGTVSPAVRILMQAVKSRFDPHHTLNPDHLLGGI